LARHYKPDREAYLTSVDLIGLEPGQVMMCACHLEDLRAARELGLRTGFIHRPDEYGH
jgi:2-haloacid dehalogenase